MPAAHATAAVVLAVALLAATAAACGGQAAPAPSVVPSDVHPAASSSPPATGGRKLQADAGANGDAGGRLEAVRTVALYCQLIDKGQFARAGTVCSRRGLWSRRELGSLRAFRFRSARVFAAPDTRTLVLLTRVRVHAGRGCTLPDGLATLFFTLGRAVSAVGGWQITAVTTSP